MIAEFNDVGSGILAVIFAALWVWLPDLLYYWIFVVPFALLIVYEVKDRLER